MIELKDWKVVLGWDATKVKQGLKSLDTSMKRVEKTNTRIADKKKKDEDKAWAQYKKQEAAKERLTQKAYAQRDKQRAIEAKKQEVLQKRRAAAEYRINSSTRKAEIAAHRENVMRQKRTYSAQVAAQKSLHNAERQAYAEAASRDRAREAFTKRQQRDQLAQLTFLRRQNRMMNDLRRMDGQVSSNLGRKAITPEQAATQRASIGAGLAMVGGASSAAQLAGVSRQFDDIINKGRQANKQANEHARALQKANFAAGSLSSSIKNMAKSWLSIYAAFEGASAFYRVGVAFDSMNASMLAASGNSQAAAQNMEFLINTSRTLGTNLQSSVVGFNKLGVAARAAGFDQKQTQDMFLAVSESVTAFTLNDEQQKNIFYALSQMASKARISTEELQRQMGDYLPTAMQAMVRSYSDFSGKQVDAGMMLKLISDGKVMSKDVLPGFAKHLGLMAREGGALAAAMEKVGTQQKRFNTQVQLNVKDSFGESQGAFAMGWKELTAAMLQAKPVFMVFGKVFGGVFAGISLVIRAIAPVIGIVATGFENLFKIWSGVGRTAIDAMAKSGHQLTLWERAALLASSGGYALAAAVYYVIGALEWLNEALQINEGDSGIAKAGKTFGSLTAAALGFIVAWKAGIGWLVRGLTRVTGLAWAAGKALGVVRGASTASTASTAVKGVGGKLLGKTLAPVGVGLESYDRLKNIDQGTIGTLLKAIFSGSNESIGLTGVDGKSWDASQLGAPWWERMGFGGGGSSKNITLEVNNEFNGVTNTDSQNLSESITRAIHDMLATENI